MKSNKAIIKNMVFIISILVFSYLVFFIENRYVYNINYFKSIIFILANVLVLYAYGMIFNEEKKYKANIMIYIFLYFFLLISFTFFIGRRKIVFYTGWHMGQYKPFYTIVSQIKYGSYISLIKNVLGNSIMIIPLSLLLMIKNKKYEKIFNQSIIILPIIFLIEIFQGFTHTGVFDIDDILLNYIGGVIFTVIITKLNFIDKIRNLFYTDFGIKNKTKNILFYLSIFMLIFVDITLLSM